MLHDHPAIQTDPLQTVFLPWYEAYPCRSQGHATGPGPYAAAWPPDRA